ncbi:TadA family conjugal transfer-associated ATPase [Nesterenkonia populi]|uniref:TadA family conjugal transfer-associated ATPase n=1 Tax=Nesterenkonia populi TaxID=1591087 RepID=UPI0011BDFEC9|nr:TadA family conjugal transfer-associated ATPase [Nesterenkonia populi]
MSESAQEQALISPDRMDALREQLTSTSEPVTASRIAEAVRAQGMALSSGTAQQLVRTLRDELVGLGPLQQFADQPGVTDVVLDGHGMIWTDGAAGLRSTGVQVGSENQARALARRLISVSGGRLDEGRPCADGRIGNCRIHAVIPPIAVEGTMISVRVARSRTVALEDLAGQWNSAEEWLRAIRRIISARMNLLVSGATGSGKTSLLAAMLGEVPAEERIIIVEDTTEIQAAHPHVIHLQGRVGNVEGAGGVDMGQLVRQTLRMRPDRLIVGECRGAELRDFLTAMNTGHAGALGTVHANSPDAVPARLAAMGALAGLTPDTVRIQAAVALHAVVHVERRHGQRMPVKLSLVTYADDRLTMVPALTTTGDGAERGPGWEQLWTDEEAPL